MIDFNDRLRISPFGKPEFVADIIEYDGPVLSEYKSESGCLFKYWVDECDKDRTLRWLMFRVSEHDKLLYYSRVISLKDLILSTNESIYVFEDECSDGKCSYSICEKGLLSEEYLPTNKSYLPDDIVFKSSTFSIVIDDFWSMDEIKDVFKVAKQIYSYIHGTLSNTISSYILPSGNGLRGAGFFNSLMEKSRFDLNSISYASPGYIKANGEEKSLVSMRDAINEFENDFKLIRKSYNSLNTFYSLINDKNNYEEVKDWYDISTGMQKAYKEFCIVLPGHNDAELSKTVIEEVDRMLMARAYYRRLLALKNMKDQKNFNTVV